MDNAHVLGSRTLDLEDASQILAAAQLAATPLALIPLKGGANNRVFKLDLKNAPSLILKSYFQHPQDSRPRLKAEFELLSFAWGQGIRCIPEPLYQDPARNIALYTFLNGSLAVPEHSNPKFVEKAAEFLHALNRNRTDGSHLPDASEACFKWQNYIQAVEKRLARLLSTPNKRPLEKQLHHFLQTHLLPKWREIQACKAALHLFDLDRADRIITPSDFGLHNTMVTPQGDFQFIDFEYSGWDDPVKTICDFFLQPKIPIPFTYFHRFADSIGDLTKHKDSTLRRTNEMLAICKMKWCCIILNVFLSVDNARREFAEISGARSQENQLQIAQDYFNRDLPF